MSYQFLTVEEVIEINENQITLYGGDFGIRDQGLLESAVKSAEATFNKAYLNTFPFEMAASYLLSICQNHPFVDGNKRTAYVAALVFLDWHGIDLEVDEDKAYEFVMKVAQGKVTKEEAASFLETHAVLQG
ncbi:type II toxin-antitoxin system death-on-curing family toxin [Bdellovibrio sp. HCB-162]|uniref:type II toxin-antitoxin system death-on-curing family toxin n=1 Tax=Bdellovibrio sp. HCB-162 TaxID=3394234 RepID=UPI0039BC67F3